MAQRIPGLPVQLTPLIGREQEAASAAALLCRPEIRLLTMCGAAGIGKTRLAIQVATDLLEDFADGVAFVSLAPIRDPNLVLLTIAQTLGLNEPENEPEASRLSAFLQDKHLLLVLDNFEQVMGAAPSLLDLLAASPHLKLLVTSREVLHLRAEQQFAVPPLALPDLTDLPDSESVGQYPAVKLFLQRAQAVKHDFQITPANAALIAEICTRLDGLPLALELAAPRVKLLSPPALLARLDRRFEVLTGGAYDLPERQRALRATIEWSYDLLSARERRLLRRLAVFIGGCTLSAVEELYHAIDGPEASIFDAVTSLMDKSFVQQREEGNSEPRLVMLETVREYAWEALSDDTEMEAVRQAHAMYYLALAEEAAPYLYGTEQDRWLKRLEREQGNLRAAQQWLVEEQSSERCWRSVNL
jgi:predicted ATPase